MSRLDQRSAVQQPEQSGSEEEEEVVYEQESDNSDVEFEVDPEPEKDETEEELEQLVFGDSAGFRRGLTAFANDQDGEEEDAQADTGLEGLDDADVGQALEHICGLGQD